MIRHSPSIGPTSLLATLLAMTLLAACSAPGDPVTFVPMPTPNSGSEPATSSTTPSAPSAPDRHAEPPATARRTTAPPAQPAPGPAARVAAAVDPAAAVADATTDATSAAPTARGTAPGDGDASWSQPLRERGKPDPATVLSRAPRHGAVRLVTVREVAGKPVITSTVAPDRVQARRATDEALARPDVLDVSVAAAVHVDGAPDPLRGSEWALTRLAAEQLWAAQPGDGVTVAVVDTGVAGSHPDLAGVVLPGHDVLTGTGNGWNDGHGHGTHVAGIVAAAADNGIGIAGLAQGVRILPVRALDSDGVGADVDVANGIIWAADNGASIINLSLGSTDYSTAEAAAIGYATGHGVLVVAAAGNTRGDGNATSYPGAFPGVLAVAASDRSDRTASFSSTGAYVDLAAPGVDIVSTVPPAGYAPMGGTSMAAPFVSAAAALLRAAAPGLSPAQLTAVLEQTAKDVETPGRDDLSGYGLVQPIAALLAARRLILGAGPTPGGSASPSGASPVVAASTAFTLVNATPRVAYRGQAALTFLLSAAGSPVAGAEVSVCVAVAPAITPSCTPATTDATGSVVTRPVLAANATVSVHFSGTSAMGATTSAAVAVIVLPSIRLTTGTGSLTLQVTPAAGGEIVRVQRLTTAGTWVAAASRTLPSTGRLTVTGLVAGASYRVSAPNTALTGAAVSSTTKVG